MWASKAALAHYADDAGLPTSFDETNADLRYRRNSVRRVLGQLEIAAPGTIGAIARSAAIAADDKALLDAVTASAWKRATVARRGDLSAGALRRLPPALVRRVLRHAIKRLAGSGDDFTFDQCAAVTRALLAGRGGTFAAGASRIELSAGRVTVHAVTSTSSIAGDIVRIAAPRTVARVAFNGGIVRLRRIKTPDSRARTRVDGALLVDGRRLGPGVELTIRRPATGDRMVPSGRSSAVSLSRFLAKSRLTRTERASVPLLCHKGDIVAVLGIRAAANFSATARKEALEVRWAPQNVVSSSDGTDE